MGITGFLATVGTFLILGVIIEKLPKKKKEVGSIEQSNQKKE